MTALQNTLGNPVIKKYKKYRSLLLLMLPGIILLIIFKYVPLYGILMAFEKYRLHDGIFGSKWVGLDNFTRMFTGTNDFLRVLKNTIVISFLKLIFGFPAPIILAILLNEIVFTKFKRITQTISYLPHFLSWVIVAGVLQDFLSPSYGMVNYFISVFGGDPIYFLANKNWFRAILVVSEIWKEFGWGSVIYLAAITGIDPQLYEASKIDGAGRFKQILHITLPSIMNVTIIMFILGIGRIMNAGFDQILNLYNPAVYDVSDILDTYVYRVGLVDMDFSFSTAVGLFKNVIGVILVLITNKIAKKLGDDGLW